MAEANVRLRVDANQAVSSLRKVNNLVGQLGVALLTKPRNLSMDLFKHRMTARSLSGNMLHKLVGLLRLQQLLGLALVS
jgi:hypothetical protein